MRLKPKDLKGFRERRLELSDGACELCRLPVKRPVADHDHKSGFLRGCICAGCNSLLGRVENNAPRYGVDVLAFSRGLYSYLSRGLLEDVHPSHRTEAEKKARLKARRAKISSAKKALKASAGKPKPVRKKRSSSTEFVGLIGDTGNA